MTCRHLKGLQGRQGGSLVFETFTMLLLLPDAKNRDIRCVWQIDLKPA